jgi:hypothetical protein
MSRDRDRIVADLQRHKTFLDFTDAGMGNDLTKIFTDGVLESIIGECSPSWTPWPRLDPDYARMKARRYPGRPKGVLHFLMAQPAEVAGVPDVDPDKASVTYGISGQARTEASWFQEGDAARNRPPRRFWDFNAAALKAVRDYLDRRFRAIIR